MFLFCICQIVLVGGGGLFYLHATALFFFRSDERLAPKRQFYDLFTL